MTVEARRHGRLACLRVPASPEDCRDSIALAGVTLSDSGGHVAFPARIGERWAIVRDGRAGRLWDGVAAPVFAPDGTRLAYAALDSGAWRAVVDDSVGERWDSLFTGSLSFDRTGHRFGYVAERGGDTHAVVDGVVGPAYERIARLAFSADGSRVVYVASDRTGARLVVDGRAGTPHEAIGEVAIAADGSRVAYEARDAGDWFVVAGHRTFGPYAAVRTLTFGGGSGLFWVAGDGRDERVVRDGVAGPAWTAVEGPVVAEAGARWGYVGQDSAGAAVVLDDSVVAREGWAANLVLSRDGSRAMWLVGRGDTLAVVDDHGLHPFDLLIDGTLVVLRDGRTWACLAGDRTRKRLFVAVEGSAERRPFDWSEITRLEQRDPGSAAVRAWVAAEGELIRTRP